MGGGCFPPPKLPRCPGNSGAENVPASPSSPPLVLGIPPPGRSAGLPWPGRQCSTSTALPPWPRFYSSVSHLLLDHAVSSCSPPIIPPPSPPRTPYTATVPYVSPGRRVPLLSSVARTPPLNGSPPPGMGGIP